MLSLPGKKILLNYHFKLICILHYIQYTSEKYIHNFIYSETKFSLGINLPLQQHIRIKAKLQ